MASWLISLLVPLLLAALWHGLSLQLACAIAGEERPRFGRAMWVSWLGGLLGAGAVTAWTYTGGLLVALLLGSWIALGLGFALQLVVTAAVYRRGLRLTVPDSFGVAAIHALLAYAVHALVGWFVFSALM